MHSATVQNKRNAKKHMLLPKVEGTVEIIMLSD